MSYTSDHPPRKWHAAIEPAINALTTYWPAILSIQLVALCIVLSYFYLEGTEAIFATISNWKLKGGLLFAAISTMISGGIIPELIKRIFRPEGVSTPSAGELVHQFTMWAGLGVLVDTFYRLQSHLFGESEEVLTLLTKVAFDQLLFTPLVSLPLIVMWFMLREAGYRAQTYLASLSIQTIRQRVLPLWTTSLCFWPVMLCIVYSLPSILQFPLFLLGNAAFSILMIFIIRRQNSPEM